MTVQHAELQQRLGFIDRTIFHALRACHEDATISPELKGYVEQLGHHSYQAQQALDNWDEHEIRQRLDEFARVSFEAQGRIRPADGMNYEFRSAVILTHIELSALRSQLD